MSVNKAILLGRLGQDPETKHLDSGKSVCNFSIATSEKWKGKDGQDNEKSEWHRIVAWDKTAEICAKYLTKGREVYVEGKIETRKWTDKNGQDKYTTEIRALNVQFIGGKQEEAEPF